MIPFVDLKAQFRSIQQEVRDAAWRVLESGSYVSGKEVAAFENEFAAYCGSQQAIGLNSGTSALHLALLSLGIGPGDEVITVPFTFVATVAAIVYTGARPVFVDIEPRGFTLDPSRLEAAITPRTRAIVPVHLYGQPADMDPILAVARSRGLRVIEDAAQAHGAEYRGRKAGTMGDMGCFSFYPGKNLGACGEGGLVTTGLAAEARTIRMLRDWGQESKYNHTLKGYNFRMDELQGAILRVKLGRLEGWTRARQANAAVYGELLAGSDCGIPEVLPERSHVFHVYAIRSTRRDALRRTLEEQGVQTGIHYPIPVHLQKAHADLGYRAGDFPHSEAAAREVLSLPMFPELARGQMSQVCDLIHEEARAR